MSWARLLSSALVATAVVVLTAGWSLAADPVKAVHHAEDEIAHAAHSDPGFENTNSDPLSMDPDLAIWTLVVFVVLLIVLRKFAWGPIITALEGREHSIANHISEAERNHAEAKNLLAEYERKLATAAGEVRALLDEARRDAEHTKLEILAEAKAGAEAERARSLREIEAATDAAIESLAKRSAQLAVDLAGKILRQKLDSGEHSRLIEEAVSKFPAAASKN